MVAYLEKVNELLRSISTVSIEVVPQSKNANTDALAKLAYTRDVKLLNTISVEFLAEPSIKQQPKVMELEHEPLMDGSYSHILKNDKLPENKKEARILRLKATRYVIYDDKLYRRDYSMPLLKCVAVRG